MDALIAAQGIHKSFDQQEVIRGVNLSVRSGEIYGLVGPDGAGKTTTIRLLCGLLRPDRGEVRICNYDIVRQPEQARSQIGYLSQQFSLYEELTVVENLQFYAEVRGLPADKWRPRTGEILEFVGLAEFAHRRAGYLSGGMKQKLGLATALVHQPKVLLLDEPTGGVDPVTRQDFWRLIIGILAELRAAVLVSTPYMDEASRCTRVGFMSAGRLVITGAPRELRARLEGRVLELRGEPFQLLRRAAEAHNDVEAVHSFGDKFHLRVRPGTAQQVASQLRQRVQAQGGRVAHLGPILPQLEDVFVDLLGSE